MRQCIMLMLFRQITSSIHGGIAQKVAPRLLDDLADSLVQEAVLAGLAVLEVLAVLRACVQKTEIQKFLPIHWGSALVGLLIVYLIFVSHHD